MRSIQGSINSHSEPAQRSVDVNEEQKPARRFGFYKKILCRMTPQKPQYWECCDDWVLYGKEILTLKIINSGMNQILDVDVV
jgi:hypothetical protein